LKGYAKIMLEMAENIKKRSKNKNTNKVMKLLCTRRELFESCH
jgi:hypothetical protein